jgi:tripartite-type tricarboxylate transporter receptor subunit TctC
MTRIFGMLLAAITMLAGEIAHAQSPAADAWPSRPLRFILSQNAGTAPDIVCRYLVNELQPLLNQRIVVDNRGGGNNVIGTTLAAQAAPDGYTFHFGTGASLVTNVYTFKTLDYDPQRDFVPVSMIGKSAFLLVASKGFPGNSLRDIVEMDRKEPGKLAFASTGPKMFSGILGEWLNRTAGTKLLQVSYASNAQGLQDTIAGRVPLNIQAVTPVLPFVRDGALKAIAVSSAVRDADLKDVPTIAETLPGFDFVGWFALVAPKGTPKAAVERLNAELDGILKKPEVIAKLREFGMYNDGDGLGPPEKLGDFIRAEHAKWARIVKDVGIVPE